jgi:hypothetical protein
MAQDHLVQRASFMTSPRLLSTDEEEAGVDFDRKALEEDAL